MEQFEVPEELKNLLNKQVVVDTDSAFVYIGKLVQVSRDFLSLSDADAHDTHDGQSTKEHYAHESKKLGVRANRRLTFVRFDRMVSITALDDVLTF